MNPIWRSDHTTRQNYPRLFDNISIVDRATENARLNLLCVSSTQAQNPDEKRKFPISAEKSDPLFSPPLSNKYVSSTSVPRNPSREKEEKSKGDCTVKSRRSPGIIIGRKGVRPLRADKHGQSCPLAPARNLNAAFIYESFSLSIPLAAYSRVLFLEEWKKNEKYAREK